MIAKASRGIAPARIAKAKASASASPSRGTARRRVGGASRRRKRQRKGSEPSARSLAGPGPQSGPPAAAAPEPPEVFDLEARARHSLWYQLDAGDGDLGTFYHYVTAVARAHVQANDGQASPGVEGALPRYSAEPQADPRIFARRYFRALFAGLPAPFVMIASGGSRSRSQVTSRLNCSVPGLSTGSIWRR